MFKELFEILLKNVEHFSLAFGYVGKGHLLDLFRKLAKAECQITSLSLADLEKLLLDEAAVLREHERLKASYKHL